MTKRRVRTLIQLFVLFAISLAWSRALPRQSAPREPSELLGLWHGNSICADLKAAPGCHDETVIYEFKPGSHPGTVDWIADKVVDGKRLTMGELELRFDSAEGCWKADFKSPRVQVVWRLVVDGPHLSGTGELLPGHAIVRRVDLRRD